LKIQKIIHNNSQFIKKTFLEIIYKQN